MYVCVKERERKKRGELFDLGNIDWTKDDQPTNLAKPKKIETRVEN